MSFLEVALTVGVRGALAGGGVAGPLVTGGAGARDGWCRLVLPGARVKGRLRHACEQVARALNLPTCHAPDPTTMCPRVGAVPQPPCAICTLFGAPGIPGALRFADLPGALAPAPGGGPSDGADTVLLLPPGYRAGVPIDRRRGVAIERRAYRLATSPPVFEPGVVFRAPRAITGHLTDAAAAHLLLAGCRLLTSVGAGAARGLGWCDVEATAQLDGAPLEFDPAALPQGTSPGRWG